MNARRLARFYRAWLAFTGLFDRLAAARAPRGMR